MMELEIRACGPLTGSKLTLPEQGLVLLIGPNLSGKSLLSVSLGSLGIAESLVSEWRLLDSLENRLLGAEGLWSSLYQVEIDGQNILDPLDLLEQPISSLSELDDSIRKSSGYVLSGVQDYLRRTVFAVELCQSRGVNPWMKVIEKPPFYINMTGPFSLDVKLPTRHPAEVGYGSFKEIYISKTNIKGLNISNPNEFLQNYDNKRTPSSIFIRLVKKNLGLSPDPVLLDKLKKAVLRSWRELSSEIIELEDIEFMDHSVYGPSVTLKGKEESKFLPWKFTSSGMINIIAHWLILHVLPIFKLEDKKPLLSVEEPEAHLDPYTTYLLAELYAEIVRQYRAVFVIATHSEAFVLGVEEVLRKGVLKPEEVKVYETVGSEIGFKLEERKVSEEGFIEESRFTKMAWKIFRRELELEEDKKCTA
ncbi:MAG: hypothetical protein DSO07_08215 [Thermoproteota archaeon]|jgi:energy-coupling factor transporter ATP-binding protein EcfA2|uniref:ATP-binding protein n=1 Tax=Candidatus Methanodesulfokora washburnensis TaxID=2478471 RepID=A0A3R9QT44_9CREN|nr:AAA family ATPase [Candidatus Methanodesulfokores washburnensis]RSN72533.1 ATP-binding protein [Candidatus Methanodesulfokores washburnensis]TDA40737.1 MAG: hypothetical protein DSO07_08215 [Candidatus Korarchaeota archaeon]